MTFIEKFNNDNWDSTLWDERTNENVDELVDDFNELQNEEYY